MKYTNEEKAIEKLKSGTHFGSSVFDNFRDNEKVVEVALQQPKIDYAFQFVSERLRDDEKLARLAVKDSTNFKSVSERLRDDKDFVLHAIKNGGALVYASDNLREKKDLIIEYAKHSALNIKDIAAKFIDKDVVIASVKNDGMAFLHCPSKYREDKEVVLEAVKNKSYAIKYASDEIKKLVEGKDPIKTLESILLHEQLQKELSQPKESSLEFARKLSQECKEHVQSKAQEMEQSKPRAKMKI